jgi:hypothetical protein
MYASIYCYFDPRFRVFASRITQFLYSKYQNCAFLNCRYQRLCEHIPRNFFTQLGNIKWRHTKVLYFLNFYLCISDLGPASRKICRSLRKIQGLCVKMRVDMHITGDLLFMWDIVPSFWNIISVAASQKTRFWHSENRKHFFVIRNGKQPPWYSSSSHDPHACLI